MPKHKSEDYKISAVHYYIENETSFTETCRIFKCSERSLKRWINRYKTDKSIKRHSRKSSGVLHDTSKQKFTRLETGKSC